MYLKIRKNLYGRDTVYASNLAILASYYTKQEIITMPLSVEEGRVNIQKVLWRDKSEIC